MADRASNPIGLWAGDIYGHDLLPKSRTRRWLLTLLLLRGIQRLPSSWLSRHRHAQRRVERLYAARTLRLVGRPHPPSHVNYAPVKKFLLTWRIILCKPLFMTESELAALRRAAIHMTGTRALARAVGTSASRIDYWLSGQGGRMPLALCEAIERATGGAVSRQELNNPWGESKS